MVIIGAVGKQSLIRRIREKEFVRRDVGKLGKKEFFAFLVESELKQWSQRAEIVEMLF